MKTLILRADATTTSGTGHVMRCLALAQAWKDRGGEAIFISANLPSALQHRLELEGCPPHRLVEPAGSPSDAERTVRCFLDTKASWLVVDGYHFDSSYQQLLKESGLQVLWIDDDGHAVEYCADLVLNQNLHAKEKMYAQRSPATRLLLGPRFALLRREFQAWRDWNRTIPPRARKLLVTMGGSDPSNLTLEVLKAVEEIGRLDVAIRVVLGPANPQGEALRHQVSQKVGRLRIIESPRDIPDHMAWADVAVSAAGSTCWELAFMGLPSLVVVLAPNQKKIASALEKEGVVISLGRFLQRGDDPLSRALADLVASSDARRSLSSRGQDLVDGLGASRVVDRLFEDAKVLD